MSCMKLVVLEKKNIWATTEIIKISKMREGSLREDLWGGGCSDCHRWRSRGHSETSSLGFEKQRTGQTNWIQLLHLQLEQKQLPKGKGDAVVTQEVNLARGFLSSSRLVVRLPIAWRTRQGNGRRHENQFYCSGAMNYEATLNGSVVSQES